MEFFSAAQRLSFVSWYYKAATNYLIILFDQSLVEDKVLHNKWYSSNTEILKEHKKSPVRYHQHAIRLISEPHCCHQLMGRANVVLIERRRLKCGWHNSTVYSAVSPHGLLICCGSIIFNFIFLLVTAHMKLTKLQDHEPIVRENKRLFVNKSFLKREQ